MLTKKGKYGLKALLHLARLQPEEMAFGAGIAEANNIPKKFLDLILLELRNDGIVRARRGPGGGYALARPASKIKLGQIIRLLDGPLAPIRCASRTAYEPCRDCRSVEECEVRIAMLKVRDAMADILDNITLADLIAKKGRSPKARQLVGSL
jgi:Rrf2 family protein